MRNRRPGIPACPHTLGLKLGVLTTVGSTTSPNLICCHPYLSLQSNSCGLGKNVACSINLFLVSGPNAPRSNPSSEMTTLNLRDRKNDASSCYPMAGTNSKRISLPWIIMLIVSSSFIIAGNFKVSPAVCCAGAVDEQSRAHWSSGYQGSP